MIKSKKIRGEIFPAVCSLLLRYVVLCCVWYNRRSTVKPRSFIFSLSISKNFSYIDLNIPVLCMHLTQDSYKISMRPKYDLWLYFFLLQNLLVQLGTQNVRLLNASRITGCATEKMIAQTAGMKSHARELLLVNDLFFCIQKLLCLSFLYYRDTLSVNEVSVKCNQLFAIKS